MNNTEPQNSENFPQSELDKTPLFSQNATLQNSNNVMPQFSNPFPQNSSNVEPQNTLKPTDKNPAPENLESPATELINPSTTNNVEPHKEVNVEPDGEKNVAPTNLEKTVIKRKSRKKPSKKKTHSQKRNVVPLKFFGSLEEKAGLESEAKNAGLSFSNYVRINFGLPPNMIGRKKPGNLPSIDLDLDL